MQPAWSDLPIIVSAVDRELVRVGIGVAGSLGRRANVLILERPISVRAMVVSVQSALRARSRQYEARAIVSELARARELAEESSRSKDEFLATLSHELRTPLNAILGWTRMLRGNVIAPEKRDRALETIERNAIAQTQLVEDLLDVSRAVTGKARMDVRWMDLVTAISAAIETVRPASEAKRIDLSVNLDPSVGLILGDAGRLQQVLVERIEQCNQVQSGRGQVGVTLERVESSARITVTDSGMGIEPAFLPHVFDPFRQADSSTKRSYGGLGIGLSLVKKFVELHGGSVSASSKGLGQGATFVIEIPVARGSEEHLPARKVLGSSFEFESKKRLAGLRILVVDDEVDAAELLSNLLEASGATVFTARSAAKGYDVLQAERPDLIVSDIGMAGQDGYEFIRRVRLESGAARVPALAVTVAGGRSFIPGELVPGCSDAGKQVGR